MQWRRNKKRLTVCVLLFNEPFTVNVNVIPLFHHLLCLVCSFLSPQVGIDCVLQFDSFVAMVKSIQRIKTKTEFGLVWREEQKPVYQISFRRLLCIWKHEIDGSLQNVHNMFTTYTTHQCPEEITLSSTKAISHIYLWWRQSQIHNSQKYIIFSLHIQWQLVILIWLSCHLFALMICRFWTRIVAKVTKETFTEYSMILCCL